MIALMQKVATSAVLLAVCAAVPQGSALSNATLRLVTPGPTRIDLTDATGAPVTPPGVPAYHKGDEHHFIAPGRLEVDLPPGRYRATAER
ncbi:MAG TPA: hypothetical protein VMT87_07190, partial [Vicinamibacteria bacterium]|nr:hypothetical protein [Vicinamibacteria bacterium]